MTTVRELIEKLQQQPQDMRVVLIGDGNEYDADLVVEVNDEDDNDAVVVIEA